jgi:uncharacterized membrane protein
LDLITSVGIVIIVLGVIITMSDRAVQTAFDERADQPRTYSWKDASFGLLTAMAWSFSAIFIRRGLAIIPSTVQGLSISMFINMLLVGSLLLIKQEPVSILNRKRRKFLWQIISGFMVAIAVLTQWAAYDLIEIAVVLALARLNIPVILLLAPIIIGHPIERVSFRVWIGGAAIIGGSLILIFY